METNVVAFLAADRAQWLKEHMAKLVGRDPKSVSRYLVCETFARSARLRRAGTADDVLRQDFATLRLACDDELVRMACERGAAEVELWMPIEELAPETSTTPATSWPCSGRLACVTFPLPHQHKEFELA
jgi:hypothetical protein